VRFAITPPAPCLAVRRDPEAQSAKADFVPFQRRVSNPSTRRNRPTHEITA